MYKSDVSDECEYIIIYCLCNYLKIFLCNKNNSSIHADKGPFLIFIEPYLCTLKNM